MLLTLQFIVEKIRPFRLLLYSAIILSLFNAFLVLVNPWLLKELIVSFEHQTFNFHSPSIFALVVCLLSAFICGVFKQYITSILVLKFSAGLRYALASSVLLLSVGDVRYLSPGDIISRCVNDVRVVQDGLEEDLVEMPSACILVVGSSLALLYIDPISAILVTLLLFTIITSNRIGAKLVASRAIKQQEQLSNATQCLSSTLDAFFTIKVFSIERASLQRFCTANNEVVQSGVSLSRVFSLIYPANSLIGQVALMGVFGIGAYRVSIGEISVATLTGFMLYLTLMLAPISRIGSTVSKFGSISSAIERIQEIFNLTDNNVCLNVGTGGTEFTGAEINKLYLENVHFAYPHNRRPVLRNVSAIFKKPGIFLIKGASGSGKSTLAGIISGLFECDKGVIWGYDSFGSKRKLAARELRNSVVLVPQQFEDWGSTIRETLTLDSSSVSDELIFALGKSLGLDRFFSSIDNDLNQPLSFLNSNASGGELRRLGILRGLLRNPEVLILDEPTANLDYFNTLQIIRLVQSLSADILIIVISHEELDWGADAVYFVNDGEVVIDSG